MKRTTLRHVESLFGLRKVDAPSALKDLKAFVSRDEKPERLVLDPVKVLAARDLASALRAAGFFVRTGPRGDITGLHWADGPLPSDLNRLRHLLRPLARWARDPSVMIVEDENGRDHDITLKRGKVASNFYCGIEIAKISETAARSKDDGRKLELYEWLAELEPMAVDGNDRLVDDWRDAVEELPELLVRAGRLREVPAACLRTSRPGFWVSHCISAVEEKSAASAWSLAHAVLKLDPDNDEAVLHLVRRAQSTRKHADVVELLARLSKETRRAWARDEASALRSLARYGEALTVARKGAAAKLANWADHELLGDIADAAGRSAEAQVAWQRALKTLGPMSATDLGWRAGLQLKLGRLAEARASVEAARKMEGGSGSYAVQLGLGLVRLAEGDAAGAVTVLDELVRDNPAEEQLRYHLACALARSGNAKRARVEASRAAKGSKHLARCWQGRSVA